MNHVTPNPDLFVSTSAAQQTLFELHRLQASQHKAAMQGIATLAEQDRRISDAIKQVARIAREGGNDFENPN